MSNIEGVLLDIDGTLVTSWRALPGAAETLAFLRERSVPFRLVTNTTQFSRVRLSELLRDAGLEAAPEEIITATAATASYLAARHPGAKCFVLAAGDAIEDLGEIVRTKEDAEVVVIGDAEEDFDYENLNRAFRMLMDGAALVAMHRNLYWKTDEGLTLDVGAFVAGLETASGVEAVVCGKPSPEFFAGALGSLGVEAGKAAMAGDDISSDVLGAQAAGITGVLVKTGKFRPEDLHRPGPSGEPDHTIETIADLPELLA